MMKEVPDPKDEKMLVRAGQSIHQNCTLE
jgi:hypothetical protein